ncbi:MAG: hypothetical protein H0T42_30700 [Deltaproteobacteria bacterium]|nr:hypothetical protein [Deltaproteobacteria bacterium]
MDQRDARFNLHLGTEGASRSREPRAVCRELGLDELLRRMPSGLFEIVGDTGWLLFARRT